MGNLDTRRLLDTRFLDLNQATLETGEPDLLSAIAPASPL